MDIRESVGRVLKQQDIWANQFYDLFLERYPELSHYFDGINMRRLALMLTVALMAVERHYVGSYPAAELYLKYLGTRHNDRSIPPEAYPKWRAAFLEMLERFHGKEWDASLATQWGEAIDRTTNTMLKGYRERFHV